MSIELAEKLKAKLTDKYVLVDASVPELKRFAEWTGKVRTVNMNCRALVNSTGRWTLVGTTSTRRISR